MKQLRNETNVAHLERRHIRMSPTTEGHIGSIRDQIRMLIGRTPSTTCAVRRAIEVYAEHLAHLATPEARAAEMAGLLRGCVL